MKPLPNKIDKKWMIEAYGNQFNDRFIREEIQSIQESFNIRIRVKILSDKVKEAFFKLHGLPSGYERNY